MSDMPANPELLSAHDHGNCELCDAIETQLAEAQQQIEALRTEPTYPKLNAAGRQAFHAGYAAALRARVTELEADATGRSEGRAAWQPITSKPTPTSIEQAERILHKVLPAIRSHDQAMDNLFFVDPDNDSTRLPSIAAAVYILREAKALPAAPGADK